MANIVPKKPRTHQNVVTTQTSMFWGLQTNPSNMLRVVFGEESKIGL